MLENPSEFDSILSYHKNERLERARDGLKKYDDYRTKEGDRIVEQYNPGNDVYDFEGNIYQDNTNAKASLESGVNFMRLGSNYLNHGADFIWNNARLYDPETMKMLDTDPNEVRDLLNSGMSYGLGKVGKAVVAGDQGIKKIFNLNKSPLEYYGEFRDEICTTKNQKDFMDCFGTGIATGGILKGVGALGGYAVEGAYLIKNKISPSPFPKYAIVKQEIKLLEYFPEKPKIYNMGDVVEYRGNEWTFADRLKNEFLNHPRLGELSGKLSYQDILDLAHSPKAQYFMDYGKDFKQYTKNPSISVLQNVEGISEKKLLRITLMSDEHRIYSIGVEDVQRISNRIESGRYVRIITKYEK